MPYKIKAKNLKADDVMVTGGKVSEVLRDGEIVRATFVDGARRSYTQNARLILRETTKSS